MSKLRQWLLGKPKDLAELASQKSIVLVAFLAWVGLGSDGLSSANYGPQEAFEALGKYHYLGVILAVLITLTVFIIASAYNQVVELFPSGGGGYKVANKLLGPVAGLVSGVALVIDYALTIAISACAASDAIFSLLPLHYQYFNLYCKLGFVLLLIWMNLRGLKESIQLMIPIFIGFVVTHLGLLVYGLIAHADRISTVVAGAVHETHQLSSSAGLLALGMVLLKAYSLGGGTYTGLEAVSNNVNVLAEPRVKTAKLTMLYMAISLSLVAGGITFLYMIWQVGPVPGKTYNMILFGKMLGNGFWGHIMLTITMIFEVGILVLGANTGFLGGPAVLANMSLDRWVPGQFANLSSRFVRQNGVVFFGVFALLIIALFDGHVKILIVIYSGSVFLTFAITFFALIKYWLSRRSNIKKILVKSSIAALGLLICLSILTITLTEKFFSGGWLTIFLVILLSYLAWQVRGYHRRMDKSMDQVDALLTQAIESSSPRQAPELEHYQPTAVVLLNGHRAMGLHTLLNVLQLFPKRYRNVVFLQAGTVDVKSIGGEDELERLKAKTQKEIDFYVEVAERLGMAAEGFVEFGTHAVTIIMDLIKELDKQYTDCMFFAPRAVFHNHSLATRIVDPGFAQSLQNRLHILGHHCFIMPMRL